MFKKLLGIAPNGLTIKAMNKYNYYNLNFLPLEVVSRYRDPQLQVGENY